MRVLSVLLVLLLCLSALVFAQAGLTTKVEAIPKVSQVTPNNQATLDASRWPEFSKCTGEAACCSILSNYSLQYKSGVPQFSAVPGLVLSVPVDKAYQAKGSILITWTMRVEGKDGAVIDPWENAGGPCPSWHGSVTETFKGGQVLSQAYIDGLGPVGQPSRMTIPDGGFGDSSRVNDPTHSGSYVLKGTDFSSGVLPNNVTIRIYWKNDTSQVVFSRVKYRSLIATLVSGS